MSGREPDRQREPGDGCGRRRPSAIREHGDDDGDGDDGTDVAGPLQRGRQGGQATAQVVFGAEAVRRAGAAYAAIVWTYFPPGADVAAATEAAFAGAADYVRESGYEDACPIATVALEISSTSELMRLACADVFGGWISELSAIFAADGVPDDVARPLASQWLSLLEGAFILCRAARSTEALEVAGAAAAALVRSAKPY